MDEERRATLGLWSVVGVGPKTLAQSRSLGGGRLRSMLRVPTFDWGRALQIPEPLRCRLFAAGTLESSAEAAMGRADAASIEVAFEGDAAFPPLLVGLPDGPPLLFHRGRPGRPRRNVAMVGSRHPDTDFGKTAERWAAEIAARGLGIVSGAAEGIDTQCHQGALQAGGETWAFVGSGLDVLDAHQRQLLDTFLAFGGVFYSELPLGCRASRATFPRRNRLISGASDVVVVLRAELRSGTLHTAEAGRLQGRQVLAIPGEINNRWAAGCNDLLRRGSARACLSVEDVLEAAGLARAPAVVQRTDAGLLEQVSEEARKTYQVLEFRPLSFEELLVRVSLEAAQVTSALCELEMTGLVVQHPGKRYEKV